MSKVTPLSDNRAKGKFSEGGTVDASLRASILDELDHAVLIFDAEGRLTYRNEAATVIFGTAFDWDNVTATRLTRLAKFVIAGTNVPYSEIRTPIRAAYDGIRAQARDIEVFVDGEKRRIEMRARPGVDEERSPIVVVTLIDRTEDTNREERVRAASRMQAVANVTGGMAQELTSILDRVSTYTSFALDRVRGADAPSAELREVLSATNRARDLNQALLAYARRLELRSRPTKFGELLRAMERLLASIAGNDVRVDIRVPAEDVDVLIDPAAFEKVMVQLAQNAREAMPTGGTLSIDCRVQRNAGQIVLKENVAVPSGDWVQVRVRDTGAGVDDALTIRVFEPFFTTKSHGAGLGLGLSMAYGIVKQSDGYIVFESEPSVGSAVTMWLPVIHDDDDDVDDDVIAGNGLNDLVILVQPDVVFRIALAQALRHQGFDVEEAGNGHDALHISPLSLRRARIVIAELEMAQMGGVELADRLASAAPNAAPLFTSTKPMSGGVVAAQARGEVLCMPLTPTTLVAKVRDVISRAADEKAKNIVVD